MPNKSLTRVNDDGIFCHIYNKGLDSKIIFNDDEDYKVFSDYLNNYLTAPKDPQSIKQAFQVNGNTFKGVPHQPKNYFGKVQLIAYDLRPDHFHLILYQKTQGSIERFVRSISTRYSIYFNKKYQRTGSLFAGPYKSSYIKDSSLLLFLSYYLHQKSDHSSYPEFINSRQTPWVKSQTVLSLLGQNAINYKSFVEQFNPSEEQKIQFEKICFETYNQHSKDNTLNPPPQIVVQPKPIPLEIPLEKPKDPKPTEVEIKADPPSPAKKVIQKPTPIPPNQPHQVIPTYATNFETAKSEIPAKVVTDAPKKRAPKSTFKIRPVFELLGITVIFFLLLGIGITNIHASTNQSDSPASLLAKISNLNSISKPSPTPLPPSLKIQSAKASISPTIIQPPPTEATAESKPKLHVVVNNSGAYRRINIRQNPDSTSKIVGKAKKDDVFEVISFDSGWYQIMLVDATTGYIPELFVNQMEVDK